MQQSLAHPNTKLTGCHQGDFETAVAKIALFVFKKDVLFKGEFPNFIDHICTTLNMFIQQVDSEDISAGHLHIFDILLCPGGTANVQFQHLQEKGAAAIKHFVQQKGKAYIGICAGAFLACKPCPPLMPRTLSLLDVSVVDMKVLLQRAIDN